MNVTAVVLNWRRPDDTVACVRSVHANGDADVIVVDNASGDGSPERIAAAFPGVRLIVNEANLGYAGGNNAGIRAALAAGADAILVLNNDVVVEPGCVRELVAALGDPGVAIAGPASLLADGRLDFFTARVDLRAMSLVAEGRDRPWSPPDGARPTDYVTGSAMLIHRAVLESSGGFDERFFLVWEDVDVALRVRRDRPAGRARCVAVPSARVVHARSASFGGEASPLYHYFFVRNSFLIASEHAGRWRRRAARALLERRYRGWIEQAIEGSALREALRTGLEHGLASRYGPPPPELAVASAAS